VGEEKKKVGGEGALGLEIMESAKWWRYVTTRKKGFTLTKQRLSVKGCNPKISRLGYEGEWGVALGAQ